MIDNSGSIEDARVGNYQLLKDFIKSLLDILDVSPTGIHVGAVRFSTSVVTEFRLDRYTSSEDMKAHIDQMPFEGQETNISGALWNTQHDLFSNNPGDRPNVDNVVLVVADGESNVDANYTMQRAEQLKQDNTKVFVVAVETNKFDEAELRFIASDPDQDYYFVSPSIENLPKIERSLLVNICKQGTGLK